MSRWSDIFDAEGPLAAAIPGFATRHEQIAMAEAVARALEQRGRLIVEAGTGTGKTFAYLAPTLLSGRRVIVSTGTKTLQDQLYRRDLPAISAALGRPVRIALLKGRSNYLCLHRLELAEQQAAARGLKREIAIALSQVRAWSRVTREGDIAELSQLGEADPVWPWVTSTRDNCLGPQCPSFDRCHVVQARREAQAADVVVVNHHLLMADLVLKDEGFGDLLPGADAIIIDEAHQLPEVATHFLGFSVSSRQLQAMARDLALELITSSAIVDLSSSFTQTLERQLTDLHDSFAGLRERVEVTEWPESVSEALESVMQSLGEITTSLTNVAPDHVGLGAVRRRALELSARLAQMLAAREKESGSVRWAQVSVHGVTLHYVPLDIAERLGTLIESHASAWICTSATLCVGEDFGHFTRRIGMTEPTTACFGSPFDYQHQALLYLPTGLDAPASSRHTRQVIDTALPILEASGGRAFLLFTSHRALRDAAAILSQRLGSAAPFTVLVQGDAPKEALLARFRECGNGVLLGTSTFWEGVDVKGFALSVVVIDKLPFAVPDDPVLKARLAAIEARGGNPFFEEQVPQAVIALKQGVGRLIRDPDDFGVVVLCDQRLRTRPYGRIFLDSLPPMPRTDRLDDVTHFLRTRLAAAGVPTPPARARVG